MKQSASAATRETSGDQLEGTLLFIGALLDAIAVEIGRCGQRTAQFYMRKQHVLSGDPTAKRHNNCA